VVEVFPNAKIPTVLLPAAEPPFETAVEAVADPTTQPAYVYLSRVVVATKLALLPSAKIANVPSTKFGGHSP
jgi:hypothetical protein